MWYHVSIGLEEHFNSLEEAVAACESGMLLTPHVPPTRLPNEEATTPRLCVAPCVEQCLTAIGPLGALARCLGANPEAAEYENKHEAYPVIVFEIPDSTPVYHPTKEEVPDVEKTGEAWICEPIRPQTASLVWLGSESLLLDPGDESVCVGVSFLPEQSLRFKCHPWLDGRGSKLLSSPLGRMDDYCARLREVILEEINEDPEMELTSMGTEVISAYDASDAKDVLFYFQPPYPEKLMERIHFGLSFPKGKAVQYTDEIAKRLSYLPMEVFFNLRHIMVVRTEEDLMDLCESVDLDYDDIPDAFFDANGDYSPEFLGITWHQASSVIINVQAINKVVDELCSDGVLNQTEEKTICFWQTLIHELRHQQMNSFPYEADWLPENGEYEDEVENWARSMFDELRAIL